MGAISNPIKPPPPLQTSILQNLGSGVSRIVNNNGFPISSNTQRLTFDVNRTLTLGFSPMIVQLATNQGIIAFGYESMSMYLPNAGILTGAAGGGTGFEVSPIWFIASFVSFRMTFEKPFTSSLWQMSMVGNIEANGLIASGSVNIGSAILQGLNVTTFAGTETIAGGTGFLQWET